MRSILRALKAVYDFFTGDAIMLSGTVLAFAAAFFLVRADRPAAAAVVFIVLIVAGLVATLAREVAGRPR